MDLSKLFSKAEELLAIDIGSGALKIVELSGSGARRTLENFAFHSLSADLLGGNLISKPEQLAEIIEKICDSNGFSGKRAIFSVPAPAVFTKRIKMASQSEDQLSSAVQFEAGNFIPHKIDAVKLDYAVLGEVGKGQLDLLVVAVKNELLENFENCLSLAGLESAIADVDFFALHNLAQFNYEFPVDQCVVILNFGYRYSCLSISKAGVPVFVGDISIGIKNLEEELALKLGLPEAELRVAFQEGSIKSEWNAYISSFLEQNSQELARQIAFFWSTCGVEGSISKLLLAGAGTLLPGFSEVLSRKTSYAVEILDPLLKLDVNESVDQGYLKKVAPLLSVAIGLGLRSGN
jgi:type IV pilus assembly protein PilM